MVAYKRSQVVPRAADITLPIVAAEVVIVQQGVAGPELQLVMTPAQVVVPGRVLFSYAPPAGAFQIGVPADRTGAIVFIPLSDAGDPIGQRVTLAWNAAQLLYLP